MPEVPQGNGFAQSVFASLVQASTAVRRFIGSRWSEPLLSEERRRALFGSGDRLRWRHCDRRTGIERRPK